MWCDCQLDNSLPKGTNIGNYAAFKKIQNQCLIVSYKGKLMTLIDDSIDDSIDVWCK